MTRKLRELMGGLPPDRRLSFVAASALLALIALGILIRLVMYFAQPPMWTDEVMLQMSVLRRGYTQLLPPLDHGQVAPLAFLWLQKLSTSVFGWNELAVRFFPQLFALCTIPLTCIAVRETASRKAAVCAAALVSVSPFLIAQSNQAKQYSAEAMMTAALAALCAVLVWKNCSYRNILALFVVSLIALLLSVPAIFVVGCAWASVAVVCRARNAPARIQAAVVAGALGSAAIFSVLYFVVYLRSGNGAFIQRFWAPAYPDARGSLAGAISFTVLAPIRPVFELDNHLPGITVATALVLLALGLFRIAAARKWPLLILLAGPVALVLGASLLHRWPLANRLMMFTAPLVIALIACGIESLLNLRWRRRELAVAACLAAMLLPPLRYSVYQLRYPALTDNREMIRALLQRAGRDVVYVYAGAAPEWLFYSEDLARPNWDRINRWQEASKRLGDNPGNSYSSSQSVVREGWDLVFPVQGRIDLMGTSSGSWSDAAGYRGTLPHPGWADNEADRIRATGAQRIFVFVSQNRKPVTDQLLDSIARRGMRLTEAHEGITRWYLFTAGAAKSAETE